MQQYTAPCTLNSKAKSIINESDIDDVFESIYSAIILNIQKPLGIGSDWIIDSVVDHTISISRYDPIAGSSYIKLPEELNHPNNALINIQNINDSECLNWCLIRYLHPADHHQQELEKLTKILQGHWILKM